MWHYTKGTRPGRFVRWYIRSYNNPFLEKIEHVIDNLKAYLCGIEQPWITEAREAEEEAAEKLAKASRADEGGDGADDGGGSSKGESGAEEEEEEDELEEARETASFKHFLTWAGIIGTLITWALFAWFIFVRRALR